VVVLQYFNRSVQYGSMLYVCTGIKTVLCRSSVGPLHRDLLTYSTMHEEFQ
jgi:hypothetical protein